MTELALFAKDARKWARLISSSELQKITRRAATEAKKDGLDAAREVLGGDLSAHNFAKGRRVSIGYDIQGPGSVLLKFRPQGQWVIFDTGAGPHLIKRRGRKSRALHIGGDWVTGPVMHPGMRGKHMFTNAVNRIEKNFYDNVEDYAFAFLMGA